MKCLACHLAAPMVLFWGALTLALESLQIANLIAAAFHMYTLLLSLVKMVTADYVVLVPSICLQN